MPISEPSLPRARHHECAFRLPITILVLSLGCFVAIFSYDEAVFDRNGPPPEVDFLLTVDDDVIVEEPVPRLHHLGQSIKYKSSRTGHTITSTYTEGELVMKVTEETQKPPSNIESRIIYFLHIPHAGGSSMCQLALENGMSSNYQKNCNVQADLHCCGNEDSLKAQQDYARSTTSTFVESGACMYDAMDPEHYYYAVLLRRSQARYLSQYNELVRDAKTSDSTFRDWWKHQPDNWTFRMICGASCAETPKYKISQDQWDMTLLRLQSFESIMFLEHFDSSYEKFATKMKWKPKSLLRQKVNATLVDTSEEMDPLMTVLDDALYKYAFALELSPDGGAVHLSGITTDLLNDYFANGPEQGCDNLCCGPCSE